MGKQQGRSKRQNNNYQWETNMIWSDDKEHLTINEGFKKEHMYPDL